MDVAPVVLRAAACQLRIDIDAPPATAELERAVGEAADAGARLIVLPELALSGYTFRSAAELGEAAEGPDGRTATLLARLSADHRCVLVAGFPERDGGVVRNSALLVDHGEVRGTYRKAHLWDTEKGLFAPGTEPPMVVDTSVGRVGVMICYDAEFPEWVRLAAQSRADVLAVPVNWPSMPRPAGQDAVEVAKIRAAAAAYRIPMVVADRCGPERGVDWVGGSLVAGADGYLLAGPATDVGPAVPRTLVADIDLLAGRDKTLTPRAHVWGDRRPELYTDPSRPGS